jgi:hypothetical protein
MARENIYPTIGASRTPIVGVYLIIVYDDTAKSARIYVFGLQLPVAVKTQD